MIFGNTTTQPLEDIANKCRDRGACLAKPTDEPEVFTCFYHTYNGDKPFCQYQADKIRVKVLNRHTGELEVGDYYRCTHNMED